MCILMITSEMFTVMITVWKVSTVWSFVKHDYNASENIFKRSQNENNCKFQRGWKQVLKGISIDCKYFIATPSSRFGQKYTMILTFETRHLSLLSHDILLSHRLGGQYFSYIVTGQLSSFQILTCCRAPNAMDS